MNRRRWNVLDRNRIIADQAFRPRQGQGSLPAVIWAGLPPAPLSSLALVLLTAACASGPTETILRGGVPARTDLHQATGLPGESVRTVKRNDAGWRLIYHPARAPVGAEQQAARALCGLERRGVAQIVLLPLDAPHDDPGAAKIDVICA